MKVAVPTERQEQISFVKWFRLSFPKKRIIAIPNGVATNAFFGRALNQEGRSRGVPDLFIPHLLVWIEMKRRDYKRPKTTPKMGTTAWYQKDWEDYLMLCGHTVFRAAGWIDAKEFIEEYYILKN